MQPKGTEAPRQAGGHITEYALLRIAAMLFVVLGHASALTLGEGGAYGLVLTYTGVAARLAAALESYLYSFHMPLFFCLSGAVFRAGELRRGPAPAAQLLQNKAKRLLAPYFLCALLYMYPVKILSGHLSPLSAARAAAELPVSTAQAGYLWFCAALFCVFALFTLLRALLPEGWQPFAAALCFLGFALDLPLPAAAFQLIAPRYFGFFLLGFCFEPVRQRFAAWCARRRAAVSGGFAVYLYLFFFRNLALPQIPALENAYLLRCLERSWELTSALVSCTAWFALCCAAAPSLRESCIVRALDGASFGIYLLHDPLNYLLIAAAAAAVRGGAQLDAGLSLALYGARTAGLYLLCLALALALRRRSPSPALRRAAYFAAGALFLLSVGVVLLGYSGLLPV